MQFSSRRKLATLAITGGMFVVGAAAAGADFNASGSVSVDPGVSATPPAVSAPEVIAPEMTQGPEVIAPEMTQAPSVVAPEMTQAPSVVAPEMTQGPSVNVAPSVDLSDEAVSVTVPRPQVTGPEFSDPQVTGPEFSDPSVTGPEFSDPQVTGPEFSDPSVTGDLEVSEPTVTITPGGSVQISAGFNL